MKQIFSPVLRSMLFAGIILLVAFGTASAKGVKTGMVKPADIQPGTYSVITLNYPVPIAILQKEGQPYDIRPDTSGSYTPVHGLNEGQAIEKANTALVKDPHVLRTDISEIKASDGEVIGYALMPVYMPLYFGSFGQAGLGTVDYTVKGNKVLAYVRPIPQILYNKMGAG